MRIGIPREIKTREFRVALTPSGAHALAAAGHAVRVQAGAGGAVGFADEAYRAAGAQIVGAAAAAFDADLVIKVKELQPAEFALTHPGQILFCYQHFAPDAALLAAMLERKVSAVAFETVTAPDGSLPLLIPMSDIAGRLAPQVGAWALQMPNGGSGVLLGGVPGVPPAQVTILGGGTVGAGAARIAIGVGATVTLLDKSAAVLRRLEAVFGARLVTRAAEPAAVAEAVRGADLVIGAVLLAGKLSPKLIHREDLRAMRPGSVLVDVGIDQGGIADTSRATSHVEPVFVEEGVLHYCVPNMPSAVARTATLALAQATLPYALLLASDGLRAVLAREPALRPGVQVHDGHITHADLAADVGRAYVPLEDAWS